jgi:hypothetical protein
MPIHRFLPLTFVCPGSINNKGATNMAGYTLKYDPRAIHIIEKLNRPKRIVKVNVPTTHGDCSLYLRVQKIRP